MNQPGGSNPIEAVRARLDGGRKWHKGSYGDGYGALCLVGACGGIFDPGVGLIRTAVRQEFPDRGSAVVTFNDHRDTVWADVALVLDKASIAWDEQVQP